MRVARSCVHFIPPAKTNQSSTGDVLEVVEIGGKKEQRDDEYKDAVVVGRSLDGKKSREEEARVES